MKHVGLGVALFVILFDQVTKFLIVQKGYAMKAVLPWFNLVLVHNTGISFGLFNHTASGPLIMSAASIIISIFFILWLWRTESRGLAVAMGAIIGGALGNVIDRLRFGWVVDFLDFHVKGWHYPAFNVADSAIVLGIAFIVLDGLFFERKRADLPSINPP